MIRIGQGYDVHPFAEGRRLVLGGVHIDGATGLDGHSDGDALTHAIIDALLGAAALGDIGTHFPSNREDLKNADSIELLRGVARLLAGAGDLLRDAHLAVEDDVHLLARVPFLEDGGGALELPLGGDAGDLLELGVGQALEQRDLLQDGSVHVWYFSSRLGIGASP